MAQRMTAITLPGSPSGNGFMDYGDVPPKDLIATYRRMAQDQLGHAQRVLAAADEDFRIEYVEGIHVQRRIRLVQEGRK